MQKLEFPVLNSQRAEQVRVAFRSLPIFGGHLGKLEDMVVQYAAMTGKALPERLKGAVVLMCGDHGIAKYGVSAFPQEVTKQMINGYMRESAGACVLARHAGAEVFVIDMGTAFDLSYLGNRIQQLKVAWGTEDFTKGPAMSREQAEEALQKGMQVASDIIDKGFNILITAEMGIANTTSTAAIASAFLDLEPELTVGRGSGINDERMKIKRQVVEMGLTVNNPIVGDGLDILCKVGGYDHAGLAGAMIEGARRGIPTLVDGVNATAAALIAYGIYPEVKNFLLCSHLSSDLSHKKMLELLELTPIVDAGMRLGEGTGADVALPVIQAGLDIYNKLSR